MSEDQEAGSGLAGWFWLKVSQEVADKLLAWGRSHLRIDWGWRLCFQDHLAAGRRFSSSPRVPLVGLVVHERQRQTDRQTEKLQSLLQPNLGSNIPSLLLNAIGHTDHSVGEEKGGLDTK